VKLLEKNYKCNICGKTKKKSDRIIPKCCGKKMIKMPLDICIQPSHAEHSRPMDDEDACDDGRAG
jgi:hypothetical protein